MPQSDYVTFSGGPYGSTATVASPPDPARVLQSAVQSWINQKSKARHLDLQLERLQQNERLKDQQMDIQKEHWSNMYQLGQERNNIMLDRMGNNLDIAQGRLDLMKDSLAQRGDLAQQRIDIMKDTQEQKFAHEQNLNDAGQKFQGAVADLMQKHPIGTGEYLDGYNSLLLKPEYAEFLSSKQGINMRSGIERSYNNASTFLKNAQLARINNYKQNLTDIIGSPFTKGGGYSLENPEMWHDAPGKPGKKMLIYDSFGNIYPQGTRTDKPPPVGGSFKFKTIDANKLQSLIQQHKDVSNIGDGTIQAGRPINSLTGNLQERARAALNDPNATAQEKAAARQILGGP